MSPTAYVDHARSMASFLEDKESEQVGDREMARARLEQRYGIAESIFYSLRYRPPKQIAVDVYARLCHAVEDCASRQIKALEYAVFKARTGIEPPRQSAVREAKVLVDTLTRLAESKESHCG